MERLAWSRAERATRETRAPSRIEHAWRRIGTGFLFAVFGVGALGIATFAFPVLALRHRGVEREFAVQRLIHRSFAAFISLGTALRLFELREYGASLLRESPGLVVANHPTLLDVVFLISLMPQADCIVKADAWRNPFLRPIVRIAGYIGNADGPSVIEACAARLRAGRSVIVFPEGTRSPEAGLRPFKRGAAHIAARSGAMITPVAISCRPSALRKDQLWWDVPNERLVYTLEVGVPFRAADLVEDEPHLEPARVARLVTRELRRHFESKVLHADG